MSGYCSTPAKLNDLANKILQNPSDVLFVFGAGVTMASTSNQFPQAGWQGLLKNGINYLTNVRCAYTSPYADELKNDLGQYFRDFENKLDSILDISQQVISTLGETEYKKWLKHAFSEIEEKAKADNCWDGRLLEAISDLHTKCSDLVITTTNYEDLLANAIHQKVVTWKNKDEALKVITGQEQGVLHIHGHWSHPESVVLGKNVYQEIAKSIIHEDVLKSTWLHKTWVYVGYGNGLNDPNFSALMQWASTWDKSNKTHYFITKDTNIDALKNTSLKNMAFIGYQEHDHLPKIIEYLTPKINAYPFDWIDENFTYVRPQNSEVRNPIPSYDEYVNGQVPSFSSDKAIEERLKNQHWVSIIHKPSMGKTTLALRLFFTCYSKSHKGFYINLAEQQDKIAISNKVAELLSQPSLLIVDNIHYQPGIARAIWNIWSSYQNTQRNKLILIGNQFEQYTIINPEDDLNFFMEYASNKAMQIELEADDFKLLMQHIYKRLVTTFPPEPPEDVLREWHQKYQCALGAFSLCVLSSIDQFKCNEWHLSEEQIVPWVKKKWCNPLSDDAKQNLLILAALGQQQLELSIETEYLPYPDKYDELEQCVPLSLRTHNFSDGESLRLVGLAEPSFGAFILEALDKSDNIRALWVEAALSSPATLLMIVRRIDDENAEIKTEILKCLDDAFRWNIFSSRLARTSLYVHTNLIRLMEQLKLTNLIDKVFEITDPKKNPNIFNQFVFRSGLTNVVTFIKAAKEQQGDTSAYWELIKKAVNDNPQLFIDAVFRSGLEHAATFIKVAKEQQGDTSAYWRLIEQCIDSYYFEKIGYRQLAYILSIAPDNIVTAVFEHLDREQWLKLGNIHTYDLGRIAYHAKRVGQQRLKDKIIEQVLDNINPTHFHPGVPALTTLAWIINELGEQHPKIEGLLNAICKGRWLTWQYHNAKISFLASGLREVAFTLSKNLHQHFVHVSITQRLETCLNNFQASDDENKSHIVQFIGVISLYDWRIPKMFFNDIEIGDFSDLPKVVPHREGAENIETWQYQLWLGIKSIESIMQEETPIEKTVLQQTLCLWKNNLTESALNPQSLEHTINIRMVDWLKYRVLV